MKARTRRNAQLGAIHTMAKQLGLDRPTYEDMLFTVARVRSAADLDDAGRQRVLDHLRGLGAGKPRRTRTGAPHNRTAPDRAPLLAKIQALLDEAGRPWAYVEAMAKRMFHVDRIAFCSPDQLRRLVAALVYDQRRRQAATGEGR